MGPMAGRQSHTKKARVQTNEKCVKEVVVWSWLKITTKYYSF